MNPVGHRSRASFGSDCPILQIPQIPILLTTNRVRALERSQRVGGSVCGPFNPGPTRHPPASLLPRCQVGLFFCDDVAREFRRVSRKELHELLGFGRKLVELGFSLSMERSHQHRNVNAPSRDVDPFVLLAPVGGIVQLPLVEVRNPRPQRDECVARFSSRVDSVHSRATRELRRILTWQPSNALRLRPS